MTTPASPPTPGRSEHLTRAGEAVSTADAATIAMSWLPAASTSPEALADPQGWYQRALVTQTRAQSRAQLIHLASGNLSVDERRAAEAATRHRLARSSEPTPAFGLAGADGYSWSAPMWSVLVKHQQQIACHVGILYRVAQVGALRVSVGGIAGVMTLPEFRHLGFARAALESAAAFIGTQLWAPFALAICSQDDTAFYEHLGWTVADAAIWCEQTRGRAALQNQVAVVLPCQGDMTWPDGPIDLLGLPW